MEGKRRVVEFITIPAFSERTNQCELFLQGLPFEDVEEGPVVVALSTDTLETRAVLAVV